jgi:hypothetical protein
MMATTFPNAAADVYSTWALARAVVQDLPGRNPCCNCDVRKVPLEVFFTSPCRIFDIAGSMLTGRYELGSVHDLSPPLWRGWTFAFLKTLGTVPVV